MCVARSREDGKFQDLEEHLRDTAERSAEFASAFGAEAWGWEIGACHDIGKTSKEFQAHIKAKGPPTDHSTAGAQWILKRRNPIGAYCVAGHHGRLPDGGSQLDTSQMPTLAGRLKRRVPVYDARVLEHLCSRDPLQTPFPTQFK
ncbi:MAG TPA: CRISPR-associated endonuclease Cas3'', partial [Clostridia bacterium]|nr:CRISPR-associated endonuclease Cas3'' [Clostridia bacterium]